MRRNRLPHEVKKNSERQRKLWQRQKGKNRRLNDFFQSRKCSGLFHDFLKVFTLNICLSLWRFLQMEIILLRLPQISAYALILFQCVTVILRARCSGKLFKWFCDKKLQAKKHQHMKIWPNLHSNLKLYWIPAIAWKNIDLWSSHFRLIFCFLCSKGFTRNLLSHDFIAGKNFNFRHKSSHTLQ